MYYKSKRTSQHPTDIRNFYLIMVTRPDPHPAYNLKSLSGIYHGSHRMTQFPHKENHLRKIKRFSEIPSKGIQILHGKTVFTEHKNNLES